MTSATKAALLAALMAFGLASCSPGGLSSSQDGVYAPGIDTRKEAVNGIDVGHRLIAAGEYELAIKAFTRAALDQGMDAEILSGLGTANLGLGRLGQAETVPPPNRMHGPKSTTIWVLC